MHRNKVLFLLIFCVFMLCSCGIADRLPQQTSGNWENIIPKEVPDITAKETSDAASENLGDVQSSPTEELSPSNENPRIHLMMLGDNLTHLSVVHTGLQEDGSYNFDFEFLPLTSFLESADIKIINQETPLAGNERGFSGFPYFNSPTEIGDSIAKFGFNVVLTATNHTYDQGIDGIVSFRNYWADSHPELLVLGTHSPDRADPQIPIMELEGIKIALLNYTYGANIETIPTDLPQYLNFLCGYNEKTGLMDFTTLHPQVLEDISLAKEMADFVIVFPHWGTEYQTEPSRYQQKFAQQMADAGADLIIGTHPHVVQPVEQLAASDGRKVLCFYSLGNYVSGQRTADSMLEAMAWVTLEISDDAVLIDYSQTGAIPLVCQYTRGVQRIDRVYLLEEYSEELASAHGINAHCSFSYEYLLSLAENTLGEYILESTQILSH